MHPLLFNFENPVTGGGNIQVTTYAALMFLGAGLGIAVATGLARRRGLPPFDVFAAGLIAFGVGFLGARVAYLLLNGAPPGMPWYQVLITSAGLVWYGGLIGGALGGLLYLRAYRIPVLPVLDVAAPAIALGHAFGRLGCFTAGCCYGKLAGPGEFAVHFPPGSLAPPYVPLHPAQLYEAAGLVLIFLLLLGWHLSIAAGPTRRRGWAFAFYLGSYALLRLVSEHFRADDRGGFLHGLTAGQWTSIVVLIVVAIWRIAALVSDRKGTVQQVPIVK